MFSLPLPVKIYLCVPHVDFRRSFDGLAPIVREAMSEERPWAGPPKDGIDIASAYDPTNAPTRATVIPMACSFGDGATPLRGCDTRRRCVPCSIGMRLEFAWAPWIFRLSAKAEGVRITPDMSVHRFYNTPPKVPLKAEWSIETAWAEGRATQRCDPSADSGAKTERRAVAADGGHRQLALRDLHQCGKPSRHDAATSSTGCRYYCR